MSDYTKTTNFAAKDSLPSGNSGKIVKGTEIDTEFNNIQTAVATKLNTNNGALTGTTTFQTLSDGTIAITAFVDEDNMSSNSATLVPTQQSVKAYVDAQITAEDLDFQADSGGALSIDLDSETLTFTGGTGVDTSGSGNAVTFAIDSTVATLTGSQTLTNKTLTSPVLNTGVSGSAVLDEDNMASDSATHLATQQSIKAYVDSNVTAQDLDVTDGSSTIDIDLDSESLGILGGTGIDSTASGTGVTLAIDATVATLAGTQTLTNKTLTSPTLNTPTIGTSFTIGSATITEAELEILDGATVTTAELNVLDGITSTTAELNILDGVTSTAAELNILDGVTSTAAELNILDGVTSTTAELNILDGVTSSTAELNILDGVTSTATELNILDGVTSTTAELNILDGVTATTTELNYVDGVTSAIQTQLDAKAALAGANFTGNVDVAGTLTTDAFSIEDATSPTLTLNDTTSANQKTTLSHTAGASVLTTGDNGVFGSFKIAAFDGTSTINRLLVADNGDVSLYEDGGATAKLVWDSSEEALEFADNAKATFGDGDDLQIYHNGNNSFIEDTGTGNLYVRAANNIFFQGTDENEALATFQQNGFVKLYNNNSLKLATTSTGIDVTGTVTADGLTVDTSDQVIINHSADGGGIRIDSTNATNTGSLRFGDVADNYIGAVEYNHTNDSMSFYANNATRMTIDSSGNVLVGKTSANFNSSGRGNVEIGGTGSAILALSAGSDNAYIYNSGSELDILAPTGHAMRFYTNGVNERMRIDSSGNLLVGTTSTTLYDATSGGGIMLDPNGPTTIARDDQTALYVNRTSTHGDMVQFRKDGVTHGRLSNNGTYFFIAGGAAGGTHSGIRFINNSSQRPCTSSGGNLDNTVTFGASNARWELVYSVGGTTSTSDRNEKQDIEELTDAEQRVAVAAKGLLRKYRWKSAVAEKGDDARIHFGIIAQDLQDAFAAEGLDAARYGMWCSDTFWVDSEGETYDTQEEAPQGATEKTRLGVRYAQLLAFIIAAI